MKDIEFVELKSLVNVIKSESAEHEEKIKDLVKLVKIGNGEPSMIDNIRTIKKYQSTQSFWMTAIALAFLGQFVVIFIAAFIWVIRAMFI